MITPVWLMDWQVQIQSAKNFTCSWVSPSYHVKRQCCLFVQFKICSGLFGVISLFWQFLVLLSSFEQFKLHTLPPKWLWIYFILGYYWLLHPLQTVFHLLNSRWCEIIQYSSSSAEKVFFEFLLLLALLFPCNIEISLEEISNLLNSSQVSSF